jgi:Glycosyl hydrolases family 38 N-terminal domain/Alpha mannosidase middle domain
MSLVDVVDDVLARLETEESLRFTLDGQLATMDDYLEIRPDAEEQLRAQVQAGRLAIGPWQTLMDEWLVSGETILRNLEAGLARADDFGSAMRVGYLPDMFGHVAQMPQILRAAGLEVAVAWRGVPSVVSSHRFVWEGIDGSSIVTEYLPGGYGNAVGLLDRPEEIEKRYGPWFGDDPILAMIGTDHMPLEPNLVERVPDDARIGTLADYLAQPSSVEAVTCRGELRSAARANLLPGVTSSRIDLKRAAARAERWLERYAEPLQALYGDIWPEPFLRVAWSRMFQNSAHDSICGCSADDVSAQVLVRYAEAEQIGRELAQRALARIASEVPADAFVVVNPSPRERTDLVDLEGEPVLVSAPPLGWVAVSQKDGVRPLNFSTRTVETRIVRGKDAGDSYNYAPPDDDVLVDTPVAERREDVREGLQILHRAYEWDGKLVETRTTLESRPHEPFVRIRIEFDNPCENQRVRVHLPLQHPADRSHAEGQFAVVERGREVEGGHGEVPVPTYPAHGFVVAGGIAVLLDHVTEYELLDDELALTVLRSTGLISRADNPWREENAGPELPIPANQMKGPWSFSFAYLPSSEDVHLHAEAYRHPFLVARGTGAAGELSQHAGPVLEADPRVILTALQPGLARIVNESSEQQAGTFGDHPFELRPWEIRTLNR